MRYYYIKPKRTDSVNLEDWKKYPQEVSEYH